MEEYVALLQSFANLESALFCSIQTVASGLCIFSHGDSEMFWNCHFPEDIPQLNLFGLTKDLSIINEAHLDFFLIFYDFFNYLASISIKHNYRTLLACEIKGISEQCNVYTVSISLDVGRLL